MSHDGINKIHFVSIVAVVSCLTRVNCLVFVLPSHSSAQCSALIQFIREFCRHCRAESVAKVFSTTRLMWLTVKCSCWVFMRAEGSFFWTEPKSPAAAIRKFISISFESAFFLIWRKFNLFLQLIVWLFTKWIFRSFFSALPSQILSDVPRMSTKFFAQEFWFHKIITIRWRRIIVLTRVVDIVNYLVRFVHQEIDAKVLHWFYSDFRRNHSRMQHQQPPTERSNIEHILCNIDLVMFSACFLWPNFWCVNTERAERAFSLTSFWSTLFFLFTWTD